MDIHETKFVARLALVLEPALRSVIGEMMAELRRHSEDRSVARTGLPAGDGEEALMTVREAAGYLRVSERAIYDWVAANAVPHRRVGGSVRFDKGELNEWTKPAARTLPTGEK